MSVASFVSHALINITDLLLYSYHYYTMFEKHQKYRIQFLFKNFANCTFRFQR